MFAFSNLTGKLTGEHTLNQELYLLCLKRRSILWKSKNEVFVAVAFAFYVFNNIWHWNELFSWNVVESTVEVNFKFDFLYQRLSSE
jgi:hypothetical protein